MEKMPLRVVGIFRTPAQAEAARAALLGSGLPADALALAPVTGDDGVADEYPGESYENQPGQPEAENSSARYAEAIRSGACVLSVETRDGFDRAHIAALLQARGAMHTLSPPG
jgi:hypothetical protein